MSTLKTSKAFEKVISYVKDKILHGELKQGEKLPPERELAEALGVGRNSVREALRTLDIMGVISSTQGAGNYVSCNFEKNLVESMTMMFLLEKINYQQVSELRQGVETQSALLAIDRISPEQLDELEKIINELRVSTDEAKNVVLDKRLHYTIALASQNQLIVQILQALSDVIDIFIGNMRGKILVNIKNKNHLQRAHEDIVNGLRYRDKKVVRHAIEEHYRLVNESIEKNPLWLI